MATFDLMSFVFEEILKIDSYTMAQNPAIQDKLVNLFLIPHIVLILFLFGFGYMLAREHKGLRYLLAIGAYILIIYSGWYGMLAKLSVTWFLVMIVFGLVLFFLSKIFPHASAAKLGPVGSLIGQKVFKSVGKGKEIERLEDEKARLDKELARLRKMPASDMNMVLQQQYRDRINALDAEIKKLGG